MTDPRYPHTAYAYKLDPNGEEIPLTDDEMQRVDAWHGHVLAAAMEIGKGAPSIPPAARAALEQRWCREDIIRRACAQVALERVNNVLGVK